MTPDDLLRLEAWRDGRLDDAAAAAWARELAEAPGRRAAIASELRMANGLHALLMRGDAGAQAAARRSLALIAGDSPSSRIRAVTRVVELAQTRTRRRRGWWLAAAAAALLLVALPPLALRSAATPAGWLAQQDGRGAAVPAGPGHGALDLIHADGRRIRLADGARWRLTDDDPTAPVLLEAGQCSVEILADAPRPLAIRTPEARVSALGTAFRVAVADDGRTTVSVDHGRVALRGPAVDRELGPGQAADSRGSALATIGERLRAEAPAAIDGLPLFVQRLADDGLAVLLADRFGVALPLPLDVDWGADHLRDPQHPTARRLRAALARPERPTVVTIDRLVHSRLDHEPAGWPAESLLRDGAGQALRPADDVAWYLLSPLAPDALWTARGERLGRSLREQFLDRGLRPRAVLWRNPLPLPLAAAAEAYRRDPRVMAAQVASGLDFAAWCGLQQARVDGLALAAARAASGLPDAVPWIEVGGGWAPEQGRYGWWADDVPRADLRLAWTSLPMPWLGGDDWRATDPAGTPNDPLTRALAAAAGNAVLGFPAFVPMLGGGDPVAMAGFARCLSLLGACGFALDDPELAELTLDTGVTDGRLPPALQGLLALARIQAEAESAIATAPRGAVLAGPGRHPYAAASPALPWWRLPVPGDLTAVVVARGSADGSRVEVVGWAQDGRPRQIALELPGFGRRILRLTAWGALQTLPP